MNWLLPCLSALLYPSRQFNHLQRSQCCVIAVEFAWNYSISWWQERLQCCKYMITSCSYTVHLSRDGLVFFFIIYISGFKGSPRFISPICLLIPRYVTNCFCFKSSIYKFIGLRTYSRSWNKNKIGTYQGICNTRVIYIEDYLY